MGKTKERGESKSKPGRAGRVRGKSATSGKFLVKKGTKGAAPGEAKKATPLILSAPLTDDQLGPVPGIPTVDEIDREVAGLSSADRRTFDRVRQLLARHLGSYAAARLWLTTPGGGFEGTPLDAIRAGQAKRVLELLEADWGPSPPYA